MKVVIEIDEELYDYVKSLKSLPFKTALEDIVMNGTPLPQGHGDLADKQSIINQIANTNFWLSADNWSELMEAINDVPTIIEADKESD